ncbi:hypothetical protein BT69DRAFT_546479 [Atractiella rhizophila]|nr:hypothetical protein BT69DRAFT_546479 [Atractiella rhizophila]
MHRNTIHTMLGVLDTVFSCRTKGVTQLRTHQMSREEAANDKGLVRTFHPPYTFQETEWIPEWIQATSSAIVLPPPPKMFRIASWNVDFQGQTQYMRCKRIIEYLEQRNSKTAIDIIILQEVVRGSHQALEESDWIRQNWTLSSTSDNPPPSWYYTVTLVNRSSSLYDAHRGDVRVTSRYPTTQTRDALVSSFIFNEGKELRATNVHLESLPHAEEERRFQLARCKQLLEEATWGLVMGDFNAVCPGDNELIGSLGLEDGWAQVYPDKRDDPSGFTWGVQREERFAPGRLDRLAILRLKAKDVTVLHCGKLERSERLWSDHCGLLAEIEVP